MNLKKEGAFGDYDLDEESLLAVQAKRNPNAISRLWSRIYKLVVSVCNDFYTKNEFARQRCELDDLIQESYLYFDAAIEKYDPTRGAKFSTFLCRYIKNACVSATGGFTKKQQNDPVFYSESLDAPIKEGEETTVGDMIPDDTSMRPYEHTNETDAVKMILNEVAKINGDMNKYCFLEYAYHNHTMSEIAYKVHVSNTAIKKHIRIAAIQLRKSPVIKAAYPERYERPQYYISDYAFKGVDAFFSSGSSIVEDIVNRRLKIDQMFSKDEEMEKKHGKKAKAHKKKA